MSTHDRKATRRRRRSVAAHVERVLRGATEVVIAKTEFKLVRHGNGEGLVAILMTLTDRPNEIVEYESMSDAFAAIAEAYAWAGRPWAGR